ncbi:SDR family oxidoreductase [Chitinimonas lacunae]|uniref:SDR family oxidoreductase n=1 Tax=Chitinimonas lacunae TaxID=1963018 RepID=A0ABV8MQZ4_9NEIS
MQKLTGKTALITGGNSGIGLATALLFRAEGAQLAISGRNSATLEQARDALGEETLVVASDAGRLTDITMLMQKVETRFGHLDILFVNAGNSVPAPFAEVTESQFDEMNGVLFKGVFFTIQAALPLMRNGGSIIVTTSISNGKGAPHFSVYAACKAALRSLVQTLGVELIGRGIRVNAISPGPISTPGFGRRWNAPQEVVQAAREAFVEKSPIKRFGHPEEVARAVLFLATEESSYVVGTELVVDGGVSLPL